MRRAIRYLCTVVTAFLLVGLGTLPVAAQEKAKAAKAVTEKVVLENEKVIAVELRYKPGDENANVPRSARVVRALTGR
jgi:vacuolar-type H+-ATPase subunit F/Vma7